MSTIADSDAIRSSSRVYPQHQAALTLLLGRLSTPNVGHLTWLDLACGRGQIISSLESTISAEGRSKIEYHAFDGNQDFAKETGRTAELLGLASVNVHTGDLANFHKIVPQEALFDFITLTNTVHEIEPSQLAGLLVTCVRRLNDCGCLFIYDMETVDPPELGAVPWNRDNVQRIVHRMLETLGVTTYHPEIAQWPHKSCKAWHVQLDRQHLGQSPEYVAERAEVAITSTEAEVAILLQQRFDNCRQVLETLTTYGPQTPGEEEYKVRVLYEFWALFRALEHRK